MKRILALFTTLLWTGIAFAQMMPDSTVQVIAYWEVGDKYNFQVESSKFKVRNGADTSAVERTAHLLTLEVVDATDSTYRLRVKTDDYIHSDYETDALTEEITHQFGNLPYEFETDEYGVFERILLTDEDLAVVYPALEAIVDRTADSRGMDKEGRAALKQMMPALFTKERIIQLYEQEVTPLLSLHGLRLTPGEEVEYQTESPSVFGDGSMVVWNGVFWADKELTDEYSVVLINETQADEESMRKYLSAFLGTMFNTLDDKAGSDVRSEMESAMVDAEISLTESAVEEVHLDTGWPLSFEYERVLRIKVGNEEEEQVQTRSINIILAESEEEDG